MIDRLTRLAVAVGIASAAMPFYAHALAVGNISVSATQAGRTVRPGDTDVVLMTIAVQNTTLGTRSIVVLRLTNTTLGPGTVAERDAELGTVRLYRDTGNGTFARNEDALVATQAAASGAVRFTPSGAACPGSLAGTTTRFFVVTDVPAVARDGDALDLAIQSASDVQFDQSVGFGNSFPVDPAGAFSVDGMTAMQLVVGLSGTSSLLAGTTRNLVLNVRIPANGYAPDLLQTLTIINTGTALAGSDITALEAWVDNGDGAFSPATDGVLGVLAFTGASRWQITGRTQAIPPAGIRVFVSADLHDFATEGRTIRLAIPTSPDLGIGVASDNDGPLDRAVEAPIERAVSTANRVTLSAATIPPVTVNPGQAAVPVLHVAAANSYATDQVLQHLSVTNAGVGGLTAERDQAVQLLTLRLDGDGDGVLGSPAVDPALATAFYSDGRATFSGVGRVLPAGATQGYFVTADVSLIAVADGDQLSARIAGPLDVGFNDTTRVVASWPLDSRARATADGMVAAQIGAAPTPATTLAPDDSNVVALDVTIPRNGRLDDQLQALVLAQLGTATNSDLREVRLWRDGGDGVFTPGGGDDRDLGPATWNGSAWASAPLAEALGAPGARLFAVLRLASAPTDGATVRLAVPAMGVVVASANDGPLDVPVAGGTSVISNSPLLVSLVITPETSTSGQIVRVAMVVRNTGTESISAVTPSALTPSGSGSLTAVSGPVPASVTLAPGASDTLQWTFTAANPGDVRLTGSASGTGTPSGTPRTSLTATSNLHQVQAGVASIAVTITTSMPATVNRGQADVTALTVRFANTGGPQAASVRVRALRIRLEDAAGAGIVPDQLLSRVTVNEGTTVRLTRTTLESTGAEVDLTLTAPATIAAGETRDLALGISVLDTTAVAAFRGSIADAAWLAAEDANTGAPVPAELTSGTFPVRTGVARVVAAPVELDITSPAIAVGTAGPGQQGVALATLRLTSPGASGITNDVRLTAFAVDVADSLGAPLARLADVLGSIRVRTEFQNLATRAVFASDGARMTLQLSPALSVPVNTPVDLFVDGDIAAAAAAGAFRLRLADSTLVAAHDAATQARVPVVMTSDPLPGRTIVVQSRADTVRVNSIARMPESVRPGDAGITAMTVRLHHPGGAGAAPLRLDQLVIRLRDQQGRPLVPAQDIARLRLMWNGVPCGSQDSPPATGDAIAVTAGGQTLAAGDSASIDVVIDLAATAAEGYLSLWLYADDVAVRDANLATRAQVTASSTPAPWLSGLTRIQAPARALVVGLASTMPAALAGDGREVGAATLSLTNPAPAGAGDIELDHLAVRAADRGFAAIAIGALAERLIARVGNTVWAQSATLTADSMTATLVATTPLAIPPDATSPVELSLIPRAGASSGTLRLGLDAAGIGVVQPASALLQISVLPASGQAFTLWTESGGFGALDLAQSYSNFPNPFAAGREDTRFAYWLRGPGRAWLKVMTLAGESVVTLANGEARTAGTHEIDRWNGLNGEGRPVRNGVYVAELLIRYDDGSQARVVRKVGVVR